MGKDLFLQQDRCTYCGREARLRWDSDLVSCREEVCQTLAFAELRRRELRCAVVRPGRRPRRRLPIRAGRDRTALDRP